MSGDFISRTLELLAPGGRFVEIGKRDETREDRVGAAQQRAEDEQKRRDDEREAKRGPRASDRAGATVAGEQLAQREWHDPARRRQHDRQAGPQCVTKTGRGDGLGGVAQGDSREAERPHGRDEIEEAERARVAPGEAGGEKNGDREPDDRLGRHTAASAPHQRQRGQGEHGDPDREAGPGGPVAKKGVAGEPEQRCLPEQRLHRRVIGPGAGTARRGRNVLAVLRREAGVSGSRHEKHFTTQSKFAQGPVVPWPRAVTERRARPYRSRVVPRAHRANSFRGVAAQTIL